MKNSMMTAFAVCALSGSALMASDVATISQTAVYHKSTSADLFDVFANGARHSAATHPASGDIVYVDPETGASYEDAQVGSELRGFFLPDGTPGLTARILELEPGKRIAMSWINFAWNTAADPAEISDQPSLVVLEFADNTVGAEVKLTQVGVPDYDVVLPMSPFTEAGESGRLSEIVRVHWELLYWQPIRAYLSKAEDN